MSRYLIVPTGYREDPFYTKWFDIHNHYEDGMIVFDFMNNIYTNNGLNWHTIEEDEL